MSDRFLYNQEPLSRVFLDYIGNFNETEGVQITTDLLMQCVKFGNRSIEFGLATKRCATVCDKRCRSCDGDYTFAPRGTQDNLLFIPDLTN